MIKFNLKKIVFQRGIKRPYTFLIEQGFSNYTAKAIVKDKVTLLSAEMLEKFCLLFNCVPYDFIEWYPDTNLKNAEKQALSILIPKVNGTEEFKELKKLMYLMPLDKVSDLKKKAEELVYNNE